MNTNVDKTKITPGDTFTATLAWVEPHPTLVGQNRPINPTFGWARVYDSLNETLLELGGVGVTKVTSELDENLQSYTVPKTFTEVEETTEFHLYLTAEFGGGIVKTVMVPFIVGELR